MARWQTKKYSGRLGKVTWVPERAVLAYLLERDGSGERAEAGSPHPYAIARFEVFRDLFRHYSIAPDEQHCWVKLAVALALAHVPAFTVRTREQPGPKPQPKPKPIRTARPRGRPRKYTPERELELLRYLEVQKARMGKSGRVSDKAVLEKIVEEWAAEKGRSKEIAKKRLVPWMQKRISRARKQFRKIA